jgi:DNA-binding CsgD family transcriptional regulator
MSKFNKSSQQLINALFAFLNSIEDVVFWACTSDYKKQLYVSDTYETIWGRPKDELHANIGIWASTLVVDDLVKNVNEFKRRTIAPGASTIGFRIARPDNEIRYLKNTSFTLYDEDENPSIILGIDQNLNAQHWENWLIKPMAQLEPTPYLKEFINIFQQEAGLQLLLNSPSVNSLEPQPNTIYIDNEPIALTKREMQCLKFTLEGKSAKEIANALYISVRTVEIHIENIRRKTQCRTKLEVISKLQHLIS